MASLKSIFSVFTDIMLGLSEYIQTLLFSKDKVNTTVPIFTVCLHSFQYGLNPFHVSDSQSYALKSLYVNDERRRWFHE